MLPLLVVAELLRGGRRDSVLLAHDAAAGSLWVVDEGSHHGGGTKWGDREAWLRVLCVDVGVGEQVPRACWHRLNIGGGRHLDALPWSALPCLDKARPDGRDTDSPQVLLMIQISMPS